MKGQINLEFLAAAIIYMIALGGLIMAAQDVLPEFTEDIEESSLHMEAHHISNTLLTTRGSHESTEAERNRWEYNDETIRETSSIGLASEFMEVDREKLESIRTFSDDEESNYFNYSQFREVNDLDNHYKIEFLWMPIIDTSESFRRGDGEDNEPSIDEPSTGPYTSADDRVHYGQESLNGTDYYFLVTSHDGVYDTVYISEEQWEFREEHRHETGEIPEFSNEINYTIENIQNRNPEPGSAVFLSQETKDFGLEPGPGSEVITLDRYATMEEHPLEVRVLTW